MIRSRGGLGLDHRPTERLERVLQGVRHLGHQGNKIPSGERRGKSNQPQWMKLHCPQKSAILQILRMLHVDRQGGTWRLLGSVVYIHRQVPGGARALWFINFCHRRNWSQPFTSGSSLSSSPATSSTSARRTAWGRRGRRASTATPTPCGGGWWVIVRRVLLSFA